MSLEEAVYGEVLRKLNLDPDDIDLDLSNDIFERCEDVHDEFINDIVLDFKDRIKEKVQKE